MDHTTKPEEIKRRFAELDKEWRTKVERDMLHFKNGSTIVFKSGGEPLKGHEE